MSPHFLLLHELYDVYHFQESWVLANKCHALKEKWPVGFKIYRKVTFFLPMRLKMTSLTFTDTTLCVVSI